MAFLWILSIVAAWVTVVLARHRAHRQPRAWALVLAGLMLWLTLSFGVTQQRGAFGIAPAWSQSLPASTPTRAPETAPVLLNRTPVISVSGITGLTAEERANIIAQRLQNFVDEQGQAGVVPDIQLGESNGSPTLELNGEELLTVTEADVGPGQDNNADALAQVWETQLEGQLQLAIAEQRPGFWKERGVMALGILGLTFAFHVGLTLLLRGLRQWLGRRLAAAEPDAEPPRLLNVALRVVKLLLLSLLWLASLSYVAELFPLTRRLSYDLRQQVLNALTAPLIPIGEGYSLIQFALLVGGLVALVIGAGALTELLKSRFLNVLGIERGVQEAIAPCSNIALLSLARSCCYNSGALTSAPSPSWPAPWAWALALASRTSPRTSAAAWCWCLSGPSRWGILSRWGGIRARLSGWGRAVR